jgi:DNA primase
LGLIESRDSGGYYDKYRDRVIFPIFSTNGRVVAFGGRIMKDTEKAPKYINSPENPIYSKRKVLYGLYHSKDEIRQLNKAILVEGYMDVIALYQQGVKNIVASSGTALTDEQVKLLSRFTKNITVLFDADEAGQSASVRSIEILLNNDFDVKVVSLPEGEDPDSYINNYGKKEFEALVNSAQNFLEYQTSILQEQGKFEDAAESTEAIRELVKSAALVKDELKRQIYMKNIARKFNLREKLLESELEKYLERNKSTENKASKRAPAVKTNDNGEAVEKKKADPLEKEIIKILFEGKPSVNKIIFDNIEPEEIEHDLLKELAEIAKEAYDEGLSGTSILIERIKDDSLRDAVMKLTMNNDSISKRWEKADKGVNPADVFTKHAYETVKKFRLKRIESQIQELNRQLANIEDENEILKRMTEIKDLNNRKRQLLFASEDE